MTGFQPDDLVLASSVDDALAALERHGERARVIAGGTALHELAAHNLLTDVSTLIDITALELSFVKEDEDRIRIGATTTFTDLLARASASTSEELDVMVDALRAIRPMQVRNVATVGGSLCCSLPFFDLPPALVVLGASVGIVGMTGRRTVSVEEFLVDYFTPDLHPGELVTEVVIPRARGRRGGAFRKLETNSVDWALASVAVTLGQEREHLTDVRIALGGAVGGRLVRAFHVEAALEGGSPSAERVRLAADRVEQDVEPHSDFRASRAYRIEIYKVYVRRCVEVALERMAT